jgi:hypothetical protein
MILTNKSQAISMLIALRFTMYNLTLIYITIVKNNATRLICCGFVVNRRRPEGETIILSLHLCPVTLGTFIKTPTICYEKMPLVSRKRKAASFISFINLFIHLLFSWPALLYVTSIRILTTFSSMDNYANEYITLCLFIPQIFMKSWNNGRQCIFGNPSYSLRSPRCIKMLLYVVV